MPPIMQVLIDAGSGPILAPCLSEVAVDDAADDAGLDAHPATVVEHLDILPETRDVHEDAVGDRLSREAAARGAKDERDPLRVAEPEQTADLLDGSRTHHGPWHETVDACVVGVCETIDGAGQDPPGFDRLWIARPVDRPRGHCMW